MSMFSADRAFRSVAFDEEELEAVRTACTAVAGREQAALDQALEKAAEKSFEEYSGQVKKTNEAIVTGSLVALFKPGQEVLIEKEDLEPVLAVLREHREKGPEEAQCSSLDRAIGRIEQCLR